MKVCTPSDLSEFGMPFEVNDIRFMVKGTLDKRMKQLNNSRAIFQDLIGFEGLCQDINDWKRVKTSRELEPKWTKRTWIDISRIWSNRWRVSRQTFWWNKLSRWAWEQKMSKMSLSFLNRLPRAHHFCCSYLGSVSQPTADSSTYSSFPPSFTTGARMIKSNLCILQADKATKKAFSSPLFAFKWHQNLKDPLLHSCLPTHLPSGTQACLGHCKTLMLLLKYYSRVIYGESMVTSHAISATSFMLFSAPAVV